MSGSPCQELPGIPVAQTTKEDNTVKSNESLQLSKARGFSYVCRFCDGLSHSEVFLRVTKAARFSVGNACLFCTISILRGLQDLSSHQWQMHDRISFNVLFAFRFSPLAHVFFKKCELQCIFEMLTRMLLLLA